MRTIRFMADHLISPQWINKFALYLFRSVQSVAGLEAFKSAAMNKTSTERDTACSCLGLLARKKVRLSFGNYNII